jgi:hypothetical protein
LLGELGRDCRGAAIACQTRGVVEDGRDVCVRRVPRQREVSSAEERVFDDSRKTSVNTPPLLTQVSVEN